MKKEYIKFKSELTWTECSEKEGSWIVTHILKFDHVLVGRIYEDGDGKCDARYDWSAPEVQMDYDALWEAKEWIEHLFLKAVNGKRL